MGMRHNVTESVRHNKQQETIWYDDTHKDQETRACGYPFQPWTGISYNRILNISSELGDKIRNCYQLEMVVCPLNSRAVFFLLEKRRITLITIRLQHLLLKDCFMVLEFTFFNTEERNAVAPLNLESPTTKMIPMPGTKTQLFQKMSLVYVLLICPRSTYMYNS